MKIFYMKAYVIQGGAPLQSPSYGSFRNRPLHALLACMPACVVTRTTIEVKGVKGKWSHKPISCIAISEPSLAKWWCAGRSIMDQAWSIRTKPLYLL